ncbi:MAG: glutathione peroxidase [Anaerolineae bacterium]|nr:glutathione peroxidase [Anaerolineae bacterium]
MSETIYDFSAKTINGEEKSLSDYQGKVVLVVNTASKCGFTPQYEGLQKLYESYQPQGLEILGFPCDQFMHQEPGSDDEIAQFCQLNYGVNFPLFSKIEVNGKGAHPLYQFLKKALGGMLGGQIKWNFTKFLIGPDGKPLKRFEPNVTPEQMEADIRSLLAEQG